MLPPVEHRRQLKLAILCYAALSVLVFGRSFSAERLFVPMHTERLEPWRSGLSAEREALLKQNEYAPQSDTLISFRADDQVALDAFREGRLPLWNPTNAGGVPYLAQGLYGVFYPANWLKKWFDPEHLYGFLAALHHFLAALFTFLFLRRIGAGDFGAFVGGLAFGFSGCLIDRAHYYQYVQTVTWMPLGLLLIERWFNERSPRFLFALSLVTALVLAPAWPQTAAHVLCVWLLFAVIRSAREDLEVPLVRALGAMLLTGAAAVLASLFVERAYVLAFWPHCALLLIFLKSPGKWPFARRMLLFGGALALGGLIVSAQYLPAVEWMLDSGDRKAAAPDQIAGNGMRWAQMATTLLPGFFGTPWYENLSRVTDVVGAWTLEASDFAGDTTPSMRLNIVENAVFFGVLPALLSIVGLLTRSSRRGFLVTVLVVFLGFALGLKVVVYPAYVLLPGFHMFPDPRRALVPAVFALCCLAGLGAGALMRLERRRLGQALGALAGAAAAASLAIACLADDEFLLAPFMRHVTVVASQLGVDAFVPDDARTAAAGLVRGALLRGGIVGLFASASLLLLIARVPIALRAGVVGVVIAADLLFYATPRTATQPAQGFLASHALIEHLQQTVGRDGRLLRMTHSEELQGLDVTTLCPNLPGVFGLRDANSYTVSVSRRWLELADRIDPDPNVNVTVGLGVKALWKPEHLASRVIDLMAVRAILGSGEKPDQLPPGIVEDGQFGNSWVLRNERALPRAFAVTRVEDVNQLDDVRILDRLVVPEFDPGSTVLLEGDLSAVPDSHEGVAPRATIVTDEPEHIVIELDDVGDDAAGGVLVVSDTFAPGWRAWVDGEDAPVLRANYVFRGVPFPARARRIELAYDPVSVRLGTTLGVLSLALVLGGCFITSRRVRSHSV